MHHKPSVFFKRIIPLSRDNNVTFSISSPPCFPLLKIWRTLSSSKSSQRWDTISVRSHYQYTSKFIGIIAPIALSTFCFVFYYFHNFLDHLIATTLLRTSSAFLTFIVSVLSISIFTMSILARMVVFQSKILTCITSKWTYYSAPNDLRYSYNQNKTYFSVLQVKVKYHRYFYMHCLFC